MSDAPLDDAWARQVAKVPAWVFHGTNDDMEPFERTQQFVAALKKVGAELISLRYLGETTTFSTLTKTMRSMIGCYGTIESRVV